MNLLKLFQENKSEDICSDEEECDNMCQSLVKLTKLMADIYPNEKIHGENSKIYEYFDILQANIETLTVIISNGYQMVSKFDYKEVKYNGYRSMFRIIKKCVNRIYYALSNMSNTFNRVKYEKQCKDYIKFLSQLTIMFKHLFQMMIVQKDNKNLFLQQHENEDVYLSMIHGYDELEVEVFYGQCLGFYLCEPCQLLAKVFCSIQLGMGQAMSLPKSNLEVFVSTVINSAQSWWMERKRGAQMSHLFKQATVTFCKQFWNLVDHPVVISSSHLVLPHLKVIREITLQPVTLSLRRSDNIDEIVNITPPVAHEGVAEVKIRLLSKCRRQGMEWLWNGSIETEIVDPSLFLLIHCHGGGFVAQSSQSHDGYLRQWAIDLNCPIVSVDYSHAPEFPFPRAHEECLYAYAWVLRNLGSLGCSPDCKIVICGDSAGGNLALGCVIKLLQLNIRVPDAIFLAYPATLIDFVPSPARMLGAFCPILPIGVLARCLLAYGGVNEEYLSKVLNNQSNVTDSSDTSGNKPNNNSSYKENFLDFETYDAGGSRIFFSKTEAISPIVLLQNSNLPSDPIMSPILASNELLRRLPPMSVFASEFDPLLDDSVELCKRADAAGAQDIRLQVMRDLPHGFLSMATPMTKDCMRATKRSLEEIRRLFGMT